MKLGDIHTNNRIFIYPLLSINQISVVNRLELVKQLMDAGLMNITEARKLLGF